MRQHTGSLNADLPASMVHSSLQLLQKKKILTTTDTYVQQAVD